MFKETHSIVGEIGCNTHPLIEQYLGGVKGSTVASYKATIRTHLKPGRGAIRLDSLIYDIPMRLLQFVLVMILRQVQESLGHATASFTLDVYGHVTDRMQQASAARMGSYIKDILNL